MALAYLQYKGPEKDGHRFIADTGSNLFYLYKIGRKKRRFGGLEVVDELIHQSPLQLRPLGGRALLRTDFLLQIPNAEFTREASYVQLYSFRDASGRAPAISPVRRIIPLALPIDKLTKPLSIMKADTMHNKAFCYREPPVSRAMFWDAIMKFAPKVLEAAGPLLGNLLGGSKGGSAGGSGNGQTSSSGSPDTQQIINAILQVLGSLGQKQPEAASLSYQFCRNQADSYASSMAINPAMLAQLAPVIEKVLSPETINAIGDQPVKLIKAVSDGLLKMDQAEMAHLERLNPGVDDASIVPILNSVSLSNRQGYSYAKIAPALVAALPALLPVIEKVVDPKTIEALGNQPVKLFKAINDGLLKADKQEMEHLERLNPGVDDNTILPLLNSMSLSSVRREELRFSPAENYEVHFTQVTTQQLHGKEKVLYQRGHDLVFPIRIVSRSGNGQASFPKVIIELKVTDAAADHIYLYKRIRLRDVAIGPDLREAVLTAAETEGFPLHRDLKLDLAVVWPDRNKRRRNQGLFRSHIFCLCGRYIFERIGSPQGPSIPLNDPNRHRAFWHKVWEGGFRESRRWEIAFDVKYYYALNLDATNGARLETRRRTLRDNAAAGEETPRRRKVRAQLKSGLELSLPLLMEAFALVGAQQPSSEILEALKHPMMVQYFNQVARQEVEFRGRSEESATLWVYPNLRFHDFHLAVVQATNPLGQVSQLGRETVRLPRPESIHFLGTKNSQ